MRFCYSHSGAKLGRERVENGDYFIWNLKTEDIDIDQNVVNLRDVAYRTMKAIEENKAPKKISPLILGAIFENLKDYSFDSVIKIKKMLSHNLTRLDN